MSIKNFVSGYRYTTKEFIRYGDFNDLMKIAKAENKKLRKNRRIERLVVYPIPGTIAGMGQLVVLI